MSTIDLIRNNIIDKLLTISNEDYLLSLYHNYIQSLCENLTFTKKSIVMDLQSRKIQFIQEFLKYANPNILDQFEEMLKLEREKVFEKEIEPMTLKEYELRVVKAFEDVRNNRVKTARKLKQEIATWK